MNHIVRSILTFPGIASDGQVSAVGIPGSERFGSGLIARSAVDEFGALTFPPCPTEPDMARHPLTIPAMHDGLPFVGLGIAPDSLFEAFTVHANPIGADPAHEHRVSAGNPLPMDHADTVWITLPVSIASLQANLHPSSIAAGAVDRIDVPSGGKVWALPLPIELYYGAIPPRAVRPTYHDRVTVVHDNDGLQSTVYFVTDGRRDVEISIVCPAQSTLAGVRVMRYDGRTQDPRFDNMEGTLMIGENGEDALSDPLDLGVNLFEFPGRAPTMIAVQIDGSRTTGATSGAYQVSIVAS